MSQTHREGDGAARLSGPSSDSRLLRLAALLVKRRNPLACVGWLAGMLAAATLFRGAIGVLTTGVPLVFYIPAVSIVALFTGWECGIIASVLATLLAWVLFVPPVLTIHAPTVQQALTLLLWLLVAVTQVIIAQFVRMALRRALNTETRYRRLLDVAAGIVWASDEKGNIRCPQPGLSELTGISWPEYSERNWLIAVHPEDHGSFAVLDAVAAGDAREAQVRIWNRDAADWRWFLARSVAVPRIAGHGHEWITSLHDVHEHKLASDRRDLVIGELRHRLKNLLTIIDALAKNSRSRLEKDEAVEMYLARFLGRLHALGAAADLVLAGKRVAIECGALVRTTLAPFMGDRAGRFFLSGPELQLSEETGATLGLALHELATNALKYGSLSVDGGNVSVTWSATPADEGQDLVAIEWKERGGPSPVPPNKEGFGTRLIRSVPGREKNGTVQIEFPSDGFYCRIAFVRPAEGPQITERARDAAA
jgi:PAS domain S-box-containing protein